MNDITIDKTGWKKWRFDEFAQNISERVEPSQTDMDVYVGLEHIDPDTVHLSRHGHPNDVEGTKLRFYKGDIIFGRRRAYQRKTALATTDGICSAHAMVLRAKEDVVDPSFFPFLFHSKQFIDMAITISVGGLSPTINWKDISKQEFLLPPKSEQKRFAELLWAADEVVEKEKKTHEKLKVIEYNLITKLNNPCNNATRCQFGEIVTLNYGKALKESDRIDGQFPVLSSSGITGTHIDYMVKGPGIVVGRKGSAGNVIWVEKDFWTIDTAYWVSLKKNDIDLKWVYLLLQSLNLVDLAITTAIPGLNRDDAYEQIVYIPPIDEQKKIVNEYSMIRTTIDRSSMIIGQSQQIKQELINKMFSV